QLDGLVVPRAQDLDDHHGNQDHQEPERRRPRETAPASSPVSSTAVTLGHSVFLHRLLRPQRLAMYGRCLKSSPWSNPYPTRNSRGASNPTQRGSSTRSSAIRLCSSAHSSRLAGRLSRSSG